MQADVLGYQGTDWKSVRVLRLPQRPVRGRVPSVTTSLRLKMHGLVLL